MEPIMLRFYQKLPQVELAIALCELWPLQKNWKQNFRGITMALKDYKELLRIPVERSVEYRTSGQSASEAVEAGSAGR